MSEAVLVHLYLCVSVQNRSPRADAPRRSDPEQEWREKLLGECQDEFFETFGQYDDGKVVKFNILCHTVHRGEGEAISDVT